MVSRVEDESLVWYVRGTPNLRKALIRMTPEVCRFQVLHFDCIGEMLLVACCGTRLLLTEFVGTLRRLQGSDVPKSASTLNPKPFLGDHLNPKSVQGSYTSIGIIVV